MSDVNQLTATSRHRLPKARADRRFWGRLPHRRFVVKRRAFLVTAALALIGAMLTHGSALATPPETPEFGSAAVEDYASLPQYECLPSEPHREGVWSFRDLVLAAYPETSSGAIWASCETHSSNSEHHAGRAWDWTIADVGGQLPDEDHAAMAEELIDWVLETVDGTAHMRLRRLGIRYVIFDGQIWSASSLEWQEYSPGGLDCTDPDSDITSCHKDHVHFTFGEAGADGDTSWWNGDPSDAVRDGEDPAASGCSGDADSVGTRVILNSTGDLIAVVDLRHSGNCDAYWSRVTSYSGDRELEATITHRDRDVTFTSSGSGRVWSPMVDATEGDDVCASTRVWFNDKSGSWPITEVCA
jgi:Protein of unknown function (DUF2690)